MVARKKNEVEITSTENIETTRRYAVNVDYILEQVKTQLDEWFDGSVNFDDFDADTFEFVLYGILEEVK